MAVQKCVEKRVRVCGSRGGEPLGPQHSQHSVVVPQGGVQRTLRVSALGVRRGPASEARVLYQETAAVRLRDMAPIWVPLLDEDDASVPPLSGHRELFRS